MSTKKDIRALTLDELKTIFIENSDKAFRAKQVYEWLWKKSARTFDEMTNLSIATRELLNKYFIINAVKVDDMQVSADRTIKNAFKLYDNNIVEGVLIPSKTRMTACISVQVG
nr:23S rRNA (adenine(2503)-C(2))-methyltransferase RlmN [Bacteroidota bacterium]